MKIDAIDKKILYYLCQNARLSYSTLADNVGISRESIKARINKMQENKIITEFTTVFNHPYFGMTFYNLYLNFIKIDSEKAKKMEKYIKSHESTIWTPKSFGKWDYAILLIIKDSMDLAEVLSDMKKQFRGMINDMEFEEILHEYKFTAKLGKFFEGTKIKPLQVKKEGSSFYNIIDNEITGVKYDHKKTSVDKKDVDIIEVISDNSRASLHEISNKVKQPIENVRYRFKKMCEREVIGSFWPTIDYGLLGWQWYRVRMRTNEITKEDDQQLKKYILNNQNIFWAARHLGKTDIHVDLWVRNKNELNEFLHEFNTEFDKLLIDYEILVMAEQPPYNNYTKKFYEVAK